MKITRDEQQLIYDLFAWTVNRSEDNAFQTLYAKLAAADLDESMHYRRISFQKTNKKGETKVYNTESSADIAIVIGD